MSEEFDPTQEDETVDFEAAGGEETAEYEEIEEEISSDEVDRVLESLTGIMEKVESETIHECLEETYNQIFGLIYEDEEADGEVEGEEAAIDDEVEVEEEYDLDDDYDESAEAA